MGTDPATSVCDSYGQTHDHENLFVVGSPTLPNAGCTNGTLTFVALTLRSAERRGAELPEPRMNTEPALCIAALRSCRADWPHGDPGETHYSALDPHQQIQRRNLKVAWEWKTGEVPLPEFKTTPGTFEATPLMIGGVLYLSTPYNRVVALDPATGRERWSYDPKAYADGQVPNGTGFVHRGVAAWRDSQVRQAAHLHEQPLPPDLARCRDRQARGQLSAITASSTWSPACAGRPIPSITPTRRRR